MYKWYFGESNTPENKTEAIARMVIGMGGGSVVLTTMFVLILHLLTEVI